MALTHQDPGGGAAQPVGGTSDEDTGLGTILPAEFDFPAERAFPVSVVAGHGLLGGTTLTLVLLTILTG